MRRLLHNKRGTRGSTMILVMMMLPVFLIPLVGLAIDGTMLFIVQAKLGAAADGAVLGAGRLLNTTATTTEIAGEFLNVNFPSGYWGSRNLQSNITATDVSGLHTITLQASVQVPLLFMRIFGQQYTTVATQAQASKRDVRMIIVVDRSGSVVLENANPIIVNVLNYWVASSSTSVFKDGQDEIGMVSFGGTWKLDFAPTLNFQTNTPNIASAINSIPFTESDGTTTMNSGTNTAEGLYQAWYQLRQINDPTALNVIMLLTDGRPSAFTGTFASTAHCTTTSHPGVLQSTVGTWPPPTSNSNNVMGIEDRQFQGNSSPEYTHDATTNPNGCSYTASQTGQQQVVNDITTIPDFAGPLDNVGSISAYNGTGVATHGQIVNGSQTGYYWNSGTSTTDPRSIRYAAFNVADNIATLIRQDTVIKPVLFVIGLTYSGGTEPLDSDWLARLANDPGYRIQTADTDALGGTHVGDSVFQQGQTSGYYTIASNNVASLEAAFNNVAGQILRLSQ